MGDPISPAEDTADQCDYCDRYETAISSVIRTPDGFLVCEECNEGLDPPGEDCEP